MAKLYAGDTLHLHLPLKRLVADLTLDNLELTRFRGHCSRMGEESVDLLRGNPKFDVMRGGVLTPPVRKRKRRRQRRGATIAGASVAAPLDGLLLGLARGAPRTSGR